MTVREEQRFKLMIEEPDAVRCRKCSGAMIYTKREIYQCERCGATYLSNFGRVNLCGRAVCSWQEAVMAM